MLKKMALFGFFALFFYSPLRSNEICGFWKSINENSGKPQCIFAIYEYQGKSFGRIIATYNDDGDVKETIYAPKGRAPGVVGNPFYCGLDILWDLGKEGRKYKGKIMDPEKGDIYRADVWRSDETTLVVRGKLFCFGRNEVWQAVQPSDFPKNFKQPDLATMKPIIPQPN